MEEEAMGSTDPVVLKLVLGMLQTNCYLVVCPDTRSALVIDPADSADRILAAAAAKNATIEQVLLTHAHLDHIAGLPALQEATGAKLLVHGLEVERLPEYMDLFGLGGSTAFSLDPDVTLKGGETLTVGNLTGEIINTPGHTAGGVTLKMGDALFTGDTLFAQGIGRVDLPGGDLETLLQSIQSLFVFPDDTKVYPGHGPDSTIGAEKRGNPYF
jgi:glyoxylase-like metal-dependent hydrolase (beta-lactamase superfamily II)